MEFTHIACSTWINALEVSNLNTINPICNILARWIHTRMLQLELEINDRQNVDVNMKNND